MVAKLFLYFEAVYWHWQIADDGGDTMVMSSCPFRTLDEAMVSMKEVANLLMAASKTFLSA